MGPVERVWVYLSATPLLWLAATLLAYEMGSWIFRCAGGSPLANPVPIAVAILIALLHATGTPYETYFEGAQFVHFLLGPATVALAVPLYQNRVQVRQALVPMLTALVAGSATAILSAVALARWLGASSETLKSMAPKSATTPIAMAISEQIGGLPSLTAAFVIATGIVGAVLVTPLLDALRIRDWRGRGFSAGVAAHGLGTARAFQVNELAGTFAGIGLALNGVATAILVPILLGWLR
jgi:predicted murein hydrolase (TIGR00659 family)